MLVQYLLCWLGIEKFGYYLVNLDLTTRDNMDALIQEIQSQIIAEVNNNKEFRAPDYIKKIYFMKQIIRILELLRNGAYTVKTEIDLKTDEYYQTNIAEEMNSFDI